MVFPVNPKWGYIDEDRCYTSLEELSVMPDAVITVIPPEATLKVAKECLKLGIRRIWMQPGSESEEAIRFCAENGIETVHKECFVVDSMKEGF